jgi:hypothetical protein
MVTAALRPARRSPAGMRHERAPYYGSGANRHEREPKEFTFSVDKFVGNHCSQFGLRRNRYKPAGLLNIWAATQNLPIIVCARPKFS